MKEAKTHLEKASTDKGGHQAAALRLTNQAITEVNRGIEYDKKILDAKVLIVFKAIRDIK
ncbi:hypothetical protein NDI37_03870 [Funiculus sociatus GB2-A5]|uniref:Uncharacterized protein n=1 Tax=Funiculus sociatus GB2-A5 TaxID=2933946 RepID=A0ABV0JJI1_9CYAN|nr:hypothetical protein [Trichocoleus sp. FACHB-6]MBD2061679.1 hypothetical protein [Trichocoleus sp. FACHB-6]